MISKKLMLLEMLGGAQIKPWYLSGGVAKINCLAAYKPKGAANLTESYINLANPGTNDAAPGPVGAAPAWSADHGWIFDGATQTLTTGIVFAAGANQTSTMIVRFTDATAYICGINNGGGVLWTISPTVSVTYRQYTSGNSNSVAGGNITAGIMALAGNNCYLNGATDGTLVSTSLDPGGQPIIFGGTSWTYNACNIQALAIYNTVLTAAQVLAISTAMAAGGGASMAGYGMGPLGLTYSS